MAATLAVLGNPNVGKTALFNALTGMSQATGNYAGVTVARKCGRLVLDGHTIELIDLPGTYSLAASSPDEMIVTDVLLDQAPGEKPVDALLVVVDAANLERNLYFVSQLIELGKPIVIALNMMDIAERRGIRIDHAKLAELIGAPVLPICAHKKIGIGALRESLARLMRDELPAPAQTCQFPAEQVQALQALAVELNQHADRLQRPIHNLEAQRILIDQEGYAELRVLRSLGKEFQPRLEQFRRQAQSNGLNLATQEARARYAWVKEIINASVTRPSTRRRSRSERLDNILTHRVFGSLIFLALMLVVFQAIYSWAAPVMDLIDGGIAALGGAAAAYLPEGMLQSLVADGLFAGVGGVLVFLPQIILLSLFIALPEDCGYMARAAFLMDKLFSWCGLSGQSFIPMLSSFACAIPGILATRTIKDRRDRYTTILVAPLMSCSARLPVYMILIGAFIPARELFGFIGLEALTLLGMYLLGVAVAIPTAWVLKKTLFRGAKPPFILEMPSYKVPLAGVVVKKVYREAKEFVVRAGTLIFAVTVIVWALAYFPRTEAISQDFEAQRQAVVETMPASAEREAVLTQLANTEEGEHLRNSILGRAGHFVEPVFRPLGWDWRIATAAIASFPAREIIVATLGTLFNMGEADAESESLRQTLQQARWEGDGALLFGIPVALSVMVFFALCCQCAATLVTIKRETGQWRWPVLTFTYMTTLAYLGALVTYQFTTWLGWGNL